MSSLSDTLTDESRRNQVIDDCVGVVDAEVKDKSGLSGLAIKAGYKAVTGIRPGFVRGVVTDLLPEFADALDPIYLEAKEKGEGVAAFFQRNGSRAADALLAITDGKAERSKHKLVKKTYGKLRPSAKKNVEAAMPRLGDLIQRHTD